MLVIDHVHRRSLTPVRDRKNMSDKLVDNID